MRLVEAQDAALGIPWIAGGQMQDRQVWAGEQQAPRVGRIDAQRIALLARAAGCGREEADVRKRLVIALVVGVALDAVADIGEVVAEVEAELPAAAWREITQ